MIDSNGCILFICRTNRAINEVDLQTKRVIFVDWRIRRCQNHHRHYSSSHCGIQRSQKLSVATFCRQTFCLRPVLLWHWIVGSRLSTIPAKKYPSGAIATTYRQGLGGINISSESYFIYEKKTEKVFFFMVV